MGSIVISKKQARDIGRIDYGKNQRFDPFVGETKNGYYIITEEMYNVINNLPQVSKIDFTKKRLETNIDFKQHQLHMITNNDWKEVSQAFFYSSLLPKAMANATPNAYSTFLKVLTDGENNYASENAFLMTFNMLGVTWTTAEKAEINTILTDNNFTIQVE